MARTAPRLSIPPDVDVVDAVVGEDGRRAGAIPGIDGRSIAGDDLVDRQFVLQGLDAAGEGGDGSFEVEHRGLLVPNRLSIPAWSIGNRAHLPSEAGAR